ncbi:MAG: hypothetical protein M3321_09895, partial [Actinomycetota bacterium]|nr:hypothetical protein [Actinomycetota bacterium]
LALFVRSPVLAAVRRAMKRGGAAPPAMAIAGRLPARVVALGDRLATPPHPAIGVWSDRAGTIEVSERSPAGKRLWIEVRGGRISRHNLVGLAFVF